MGIHRGDTFEEYINLSNMAYERKQIALVQKIATPVKVLKRVGNKIVNGYFEQKSTLDFIGVYKSISVAFDAKETNQTRLPLKNIHQHQVEFMRNWHINGGRCFLLVSFRKYNKVYRLEFEQLLEKWIEWKENKGKKGYASIPHQYFKDNCKELKSKDGILLDYLEGVEKNEEANCI